MLGSACSPCAPVSALHLPLFIHDEAWIGTRSLASAAAPDFTEKLTFSSKVICSDNSEVFIFQQSHKTAVVINPAGCSNTGADGDLLRGSLVNVFFTGFNNLREDILANFSNIHNTAYLLEIIT